MFEHSDLYSADSAAVDGGTRPSTPSKELDKQNIALRTRLEEIEVACRALEDNNRTLTELNQTLQQKVSQSSLAAQTSTLYLQRANQELVRRNHVLRELGKAETRNAAQVTSELVTLVHMLLAEVAAIRNAPGLKPAGHVEPLLESLQRNCMRLMRRTSDFRDLLRIAGGIMRLQYEPADINGLLGEIAKSVSGFLRIQRIELETRFDEQVPEIWIDHEKFEGIVLHLLFNAAKVTSRGGQVRLCTELSGNRVRIAVQDNGPGLPPERLRILNEMFQSEWPHRVPGRFGPGLGLSLVKRIVELHNGRVEASSEFRKGALFSIELPLGEATIRDSARQRSMESKPGRIPYLKTDEIKLADFHQIEDLLKYQPKTAGRPTVLVVALSSSDLYVTCAQLRKRYNVMSAGSRTEALAMARDHTPDLVIADTDLEEENAGIQLCQELKKDKATRNTSVILMNSGDAARVMREGFVAGADDFLIKPLALTELEARTERFLARPT